MKKRLIILALVIWLAGLALPVSQAAAPSDPVSVIGDLLKTNQYDLARQRITEYLQGNPEDVNILMMQGNLILNEQLAPNAADYTVVNESIYQKVNGYNQAAPLMIPPGLAGAVAGLWRKCLELEPDRADIREGLAYLYAQADLKTELLALVPDLQAGATQPDEAKYLLCNLAKLLAERNDLNAAAEVYQAIVNLYPREPLVYADLADTLLQQGRLTETRQYLVIGVGLPGPDQKQCYWNAFKLEATLGNYPQALAALQGLAKLTRKRDYQLYQGLLHYYTNQSQWRREISGFLAAPSSTTDSNNRALAKFLISQANRHDYASYQKSLTYKVDAAFRLLLQRRAMALFPNQPGPVIGYAEFHNIHHHYGEALRVLTPWEGRPLSGQELSEAFQLQYAWALQNTAALEQANQHWLKLFNAQDFFIKSAAIYFYGKNLYYSGGQAEAARFFKMIAPQAADSKYAFYCQRMLRQWEREAAAGVAPSPTPTVTSMATVPASTPTPVASPATLPGIK